MFLSREQRKLIAIIIVLIVAGATTIKRLTGKDVLTPLIGRGRLMQAFYILVAISVVCIIYKLVDDNEEPKVEDSNRLISRMP